jgi:hypothetical protein
VIKAWFVFWVAVAVVVLDVVRCVCAQEWYDKIIQPLLASPHVFKVPAENSLGHMVKTAYLSAESFFTPVTETWPAVCVWKVYAVWVCGCVRDGLHTTQLKDAYLAVIRREWSLRDLMNQILRDGYSVRNSGCDWWQSLFFFSFVPHMPARACSMMGGSWSAICV